MSVEDRHSTNFRDITGQKFGSWTVREFAYSKKWRAYWLCECDCGNKRIMRYDTLQKIKWPYCMECKPRNELKDISEFNESMRIRIRTGENGLMSNTMITDGEIVHGYSSDKYYFVFDKDQLEEIKKHTWRHHDARGYIYTSKKQKFVYLHTLLLGDLSCERKVDHMNLKKYDNRKRNLRFCTDHQNAFNRGIVKANTLGYKGISKTKYGRYGGVVGFCRKHVSVGYYATPTEAATAYDYAAYLLHGEFAKRNCDLFDNLGECTVEQKNIILKKIKTFLTGIQWEKDTNIVETAFLRVKNEYRKIAVV